MLVQTVIVVKLENNVRVVKGINKIIQCETLQPTLFQHPGTGKPSSPYIKKMRK